MRALGAGQRRRSRTDLGDQQAVEVAWAVPETAGESGHAAAVDHAVGDEAHGPSDCVPAVFHSGEPGAASGRHR